MSVASEIKCARCDRKYSAVRARCPFCGAQRLGRGKYSDEYESTRGKMLLSILIMLVLVVAAGVLVFSAPALEEDESPEMSESSNLPGEDGIQTDEGDNFVEPPPVIDDDDDDDDDEPPPALQSATILHNVRGGQSFTGGDNPEYTMSVGDQEPVILRTVPRDIDVVVEWSSSNPSVFDVVANSPGGREANTHAAGPGQATLSATVDGEVVATVLVRVRAEQAAQAQT